jgi:hypothetical protein
MFDANPHLLHQAFDSMVMHLRNSLALNNTPESDMAASGWKPLADDLHRLGLDKSLSDAWVSWISSREKPTGPTRIRMLHSMERELVSLEAFNDLLELHRLGVLSPLQVENVIENCAYLPSLPAGPEQVRILALRVFADQFQAQGYGPSH